MVRTCINITLPFCRSQRLSSAVYIVEHIPSSLDIHGLLAGLSIILVMMPAEVFVTSDLFVSLIMHRRISFAGHLYHPPYTTVLQVCGETNGHIYKTILRDSLLETRHFEPSMTLFQSVTVFLAVYCSATTAWNTFIVPHSHNSSTDDAPSLIATLATGNLSANTTILFERGKTYNIFSPIKFPAFQNVEVAIEGNISYPVDISVVQGQT